MDKILWDLFRNTGDIKYYLLLQKLGVSENGNKKSSGDSVNGDKL